MERKYNIIKVLQDCSLLLMIVTGTNICAQVGIGTTIPNAALEIVSDRDGILIPRVALTATFTAAPVTAPIDSELIYNTATEGAANTAVSPGYYYWSTTSGQWVRLATGADIAASRDNLGNHTATQTLNMDNNTIVAASAVGIGSTTTTAPEEKLQVTDGNILLNGTTTRFIKWNAASIGPPTPTVVSAGTKLILRPGVNQTNLAQVDYAMGIENNAMWYSIPNSSSGFSHKFYGGALHLMTIRGDGNVGIGTTSPVTKLDVNGTTKTTGFIMPTSAVNGAVLTSDVNGVGTWGLSAINNIVASLSSGGINIAYDTSQYRQTGSSITLPPGKYAVNISMLMRITAVGITPPNSSFWLRSSFTDQFFDGAPLSNDIVGGKLASGSLSGSSYYAMLNGTIIINNSTGANKTYYYVAGNSLVSNSTQTIENFGGANTDENRIIAYKIN